MLNTPQRRTPRSSLSTQTPITQASTSLRRALGQQAITPQRSSSDLRAEHNTPQAGPLEKLKAREGVSRRGTPRKIRRESFVSRVSDYPSNALINLHTTLSLLSLDPLAYPAALGLHALHALTRLPTFAAALPSWRDYFSFTKVTPGRYEGVVHAGDADARLEALRRGAEAGGGAAWAGKMLWLISIALVLLSVANTAYLFTRRRTYHLVLRPDPLSSPNARSTTINFAPPRAAPSLLARLRHNFLLALPLSSYFYKQKHEEVKEFKVQRLDVWTPDYVKWSLVLFSLYPPPIALLWHFLTPSNFLLAALVGPALVGQTYVLVRLYAGLVRDRHLLQGEVMHEYNAKFVNPRIFVQKRDAQTSTSDLDITQDPSYVPRLNTLQPQSLAPPSSSHRLTKQPSLSHLREERPAGWTPPGRVRRSTMGPAQVAAVATEVDTPVRQHRAAWVGEEESEVAEEVHREAERQRRLAKRLGGEEMPGSEARRRRRRTGEVGARGE